VTELTVPKRMIFWEKSLGGKTGEGDAGYFPEKNHPIEKVTLNLNGPWRRLKQACKGRVKFGKGSRLGEN